ncbi:MAG: pyrimidine dimer DNA glycosylase/endonuclease V [Patescibacteria group bacterium]
MRVWDLDVKNLCDNHLLGEHRELHAIWNILTLGKRGYVNHPETKRWIGKLRALYCRHEDEVREIERRGWHHHSDLDEKLASGNAIQDVFIDSIEKQKELLKNKPCICYKSKPEV